MGLNPAPCDTGAGGPEPRRARGGEQRRGAAPVIGAQPGRGVTGGGGFRRFPRQVRLTHVLSQGLGHAMTALTWRLAFK